MNFKKGQTIPKKAAAKPVKEEVKEEAPAEPIEEAEVLEVVYFQYDRDTVLEAAVVAKHEDSVDLVCNGVVSQKYMTSIATPPSAREFLKAPQGRPGQVGTWFPKED